MEFLDAKSKGVMEMLAEKNKDIKKAYDLLQIRSKDEKARMLYEARQAEISDQLTRIKAAEEKGVLRVVENLLKMGLNVEQISIAAEISVERVLEIKKGIIN